MHRLVLSIPLAAVVAPILLGVLAHKLLRKRRACAQRDADDQHPGTPSPPIQPSGNDFDVFLSFRDVDTRTGFTDYLYCSLVDVGIRVFIDDSEPRLGERLSEELMQAISNSNILIPIISENYASSKWCLQELVCIMECRKQWGHKVFPIFYKVEPAGMRYQMGRFGEAFRNYERGRFDPEVVAKWKKALAEVSSLSGWISEKFANGREGELVKSVVQKVLKELKKVKELVGDDYLVGIDSPVEEVMELVNKNANASATLRVGIYGIEGIGKTTLAKVIYNKLSDLFVHRSFIANIRESCECDGINHLQNQLIFDMQKETNQFCNNDEGIECILSRFKDEKVLIILDDVDTTDQLKALAGNPHWFGSGSRIFVTTRNKSVLDNARVEIKYEHKQMDEKQSIILFSRHAFRRDYPPSEFLALSRLVVSTTEGIPLAVKDIGSFLCEKPSQIWRETIQKMQNIPHMAVQEKWRIIYEGVREGRRNMEDVSSMNPAMPSPSIPPSENDYEVFLNFRGVDTRRDFTDYLYRSLVDVGIRVFTDDDELRVGDRLSEDLMQAIRNSNILIPIISVNYASSKWCLDELVQMMKCKRHSGHIVLPIFYKVEPADVRDQKGRFGEAFHYSGRRFDQKFTKEWQQALTEVSSLRGWQFANGPLGELVKSIVQKVLNELKKTVELDVSKNLVGIDSHVEEVMKLINGNSGATLFVGIYGMGGIGKTALVRVIYNKLLNQFEHCSFIVDIRESCNRNGISYLQNQLIRDILRRDIRLHNKDHGIRITSSELKDKKVLIILDDLDTTDQLTALAGNPNWFAPGSRIFVTTRDKSVLVRASVEIKYEHKEMDEEQSLILFSRHAFRSDSPPSEFSALTHVVVSITGGLPLALKVVGSFLCGKPAMLWKEAICKLQNMPHKEVPKKLMISYEALEEDQRQMFLDIACFLIGSDARIACYMWDACGIFARGGIEVLRSLLFISIGDNHEFGMHDQMRDLGREIVRAENYHKPHQRSRLWDYEEVLEVLESKKGTGRIEAICLEEGDSNYIDDQGSCTFADEQFRNLSNLRFLHMSAVNLGGDFSKLFSQLRWLKWGNCPSNFEASNFPAGELVILNLSGSLISDVWQGWHSMMKAEKLKVLNLTNCHSLKGTPYLSAFKRLEILILRDCSALEQIDNCIGDMENLVSLDLSGCSLLERLPLQMAKLEQLKELLLDETAIQEIPSFISSLKKLKTLSAKDCKDCKSLIELPVSIGSLENLSTLVSSSYVELATLPNNIVFLENLWCLSLGSYHHLRKIPNSIGKWLTRLDLSGCSHLVELPPEMGELKQLKELRLDHISIQEIPSSIGSLEKLKMLSARDCKSLIGLPDSLGSLCNLSTLVLSGCVEFATLPNSIGFLENLRRLSLRSCHQMREIPSLIGKLKLLTQLDLSGCLCLVELPPQIGELKQLKKLRLDQTAIQEIPSSIGSLKKLEMFSAMDCKSLIGLLDSISSLRNLSTLVLSGCVELATLPNSIGFLDNLRHLLLRNCHQLREIPSSIGKLKLLTQLDLSGCLCLVKLPPQIGELKQLRKLRLDQTAIQEIPPSIGSLKKLEMFSAMDCKSLIGLPDSIGGLGNLSTLVLSGCVELATLPNSIGFLDNLRHLLLRNCHQLREIPSSIGKLKLLTQLDLSGCLCLVKLPPQIGELKQLRKLRLDQTAIQEIPPSIGSLKKLEMFSAMDCKSLIGLPDSIGGLGNLSTLVLSGCVELATLPDSIGFLDNLRLLLLPSCHQLREIPSLIGKLKLWTQLRLSTCFYIMELPPQIIELKKLKKLRLDQTAIQEIPSSIGSLEKLETLSAMHCKSLIELPDSIASLCNLSTLVFSGCVEIATLPNSIRFLDNSIGRWLTRLDFSGCSHLVELPPEMGELKQLKELRLDQTAIQEIPSSIGSLEKLEMLSARDCESLIGLPDSIGSLCNLSTLVLSGCVEFATLPNSIGFLENLRCLLLRSCHQLREIPSSIGKLKLLTQLDLSGCLCLVELPPQIGELKQLKELCLDQTPIQENPSSIGFSREARDA